MFRALSWRTIRHATAGRSSFSWSRRLFRIYKHNLEEASIGGFKRAVFAVMMVHLLVFFTLPDRMQSWKIAEKDIENRYNIKIKVNILEGQHKIDGLLPPFISVTVRSGRQKGFSVFDEAAEIYRQPVACTMKNTILIFYRTAGGIQSYR